MFQIGKSSAEVADIFLQTEQARLKALQVLKDAQVGHFYSTREAISIHPE